MEKTMNSSIMGSFKYDERFNTYKHTEGKVYYSLRIEQDYTKVHELMSRAEKIFCEFAEFEDSSGTSLN